MNLKQVLATTTAIAALTAGAQAQAADTYVSIFGGWSSLDSDFGVGTSTSQSNQLLDWDFGLIRATGLGGVSAPFYLSTLPSSVTGYLNYSGTQPYYINSAYVGLTANLTTSQFHTANWNGGFDGGFVIGAAFGWDFGEGWRAEAEIAYRQNDVDSAIRVRGIAGYGATGNLGLVFNAQGSTSSFASASVAGTGDLGGFVSNVIYTGTSAAFSAAAYFGSTSAAFSTKVNASGDASIWSFMANFWYDFGMEDSPFTPFVGAGIGMANVSFDHSISFSTNVATTNLPAMSYYLPTGTLWTITGSGSGSNLGTGYTFTAGGSGSRNFAGSYAVSGDDLVFAYQFGAGVGYELGNGMAITAQYRYFATTEAEFGPQVAFDVDSHAFMVGLTIPLN